MFVGIACCQADSTKGVLFFCDQRISQNSPHLNPLPGRDCPRAVARTKWEVMKSTRNRPAVFQAGYRKRLLGRRGGPAR
jgi:hypothetical protein